MAGAVAELLTDRAMHARFSRAARVRAETHFQREPLVARYEAVYRRVASRDRAR
jgi:hypothetical protein